MAINRLSFDADRIKTAVMASLGGRQALGAHESAAGGLWRAVERISSLHGGVLQIFTRNQRQWAASPLADEEIADFLAARRLWGEHPVVSHASYLINLASPDDEAWQRSVQALTQELARCRALGIAWVVVHPGSALGQDAGAAIRRAAQGLDHALEADDAASVGGAPAQILLENVAGQGTNIGKTFEELGDILNHTSRRDRLGLCFDTCHAFAAGYDLSREPGFEAALTALDRHVGLERLRLMHVNDSKYALGSRKDRHEHIGQGQIGLEGFRLVMTDSRLAAVPKVLETHKSNDLHEDAANLAVLRGLECGQRPCTGL